jgi:phosphatidylethanolamine-binding protein (PEBP) family uncharacterized protein
MLGRTGGAPIWRARFVRAIARTNLALALFACASAPSPSGSGGTGGAPSTGGGPSGSAGTTAGSSAGTSPASGGAGGPGGAGNSGGSAQGGAAGTSPGGAASGGVAGTSAAGATGSAGSPNFSLTSPDLVEGAQFADKYTCAAAGFDASLLPELVWTPGPAGTRSYAITFIDVTLTQAQPPSDLGYHWVIYDIPATMNGLPEEFSDAASVGAAQNRAYLGPCPNFSGGAETHTYEFAIYALEAEALSITPTTGTEAVKVADAKLRETHLAVAKLSGKSDASPP